MKYFSPGELLIAVPAALLLGALFSLVYSFTISFCRSSIERTVIIKNNVMEKLKLKKKNKAENEKRHALKFTSFAACQFVSFLLIIFFAIIYSVFIYIATDGIFRIYILLLVIASFFATKKAIARSFDKISIFITSLFFELLNKVINLLITVISFVKRTVCTVKKRVNQLHIKK